jgi:FAD/FMN-containing dehydrogenase
LFPFETVRAAIEAGVDLVSQAAPLDAISVVQSTEGTHLAVRATGRSRAVEEILTSILPAAASSPQRLDDEESASWWQRTTDEFAEDSANLLIAVSSRIEHMATLTSSLNDIVPQASLLIMPGYGSIRISIPLMEIPDPSSTLEQIISQGVKHEGSCVVEAAPIDVRSTFEVWGPPDSGLATMQRIKRTFDPSAILNRGRLFV